MATATLIATAIGLIILVVTAYVLIGGTLSAAEIVSSAQKDTAGLQEARMRTSIAITGTALDTNATTLYVEMENTGSEIIGDYEHMDIFLAAEGEPLFYPYGSGPGTWQILTIIPDSIHPGQFDPGETMNISVVYSGSDPAWVQASTSSGVSDSAYVG